MKLNRGQFTLRLRHRLNSITPPLQLHPDAGLMPPPYTHLWGKGLFDGVKGSPSIRQRVLILALGRFPIDCLLSPSNTAPHSIGQRHSAQSVTGSCLFAVFGSGCATARLLLKTYKCLRSRAREGENSNCLPRRASPTYSVAFIMVEQLWRRRESSIPACFHEEQFHPANKQQRDTETLLGGRGEEGWAK